MLKELLLLFLLAAIIVRVLVKLYNATEQAVVFWKTVDVPLRRSARIRERVRNISPQLQRRREERREKA